MPPSYGVSSGPCIRASQTKRSSSLIGPAVMPSGGSCVRCLYSWKRRFDATDVMFACLDRRWMERVYGRKRLGYEW